MESGCLSVESKVQSVQLLDHQEGSDQACPRYSPQTQFDRRHWQLPTREQSYVK